MFGKVLVANRGEIALRVIRACKELGIRSVAVYSEADVDSLHVQLADEAICIGGAPSAESYLRVDRILSAAEIGDVDAIHPGYGFLAEDASFAGICESCRIKFIGPSSAAIAALGDKNRAREIAAGAGVPVVPGSDGVVADEREAIAVAHRIGYPVMIKARAGGGGRGMRLARNEASLIQGFRAAGAEAEKAFGDGALYVERLVGRPHHIEFQIMADRHGRTVHLGERDCSLQRRHQKLVEECPSPIMTEERRAEMGACAVRLAEAVGYENAGTVEFLVDDAGGYYFIEMNTRIQVEHPITEEVYGVDLVKEQIRIAAGEGLSPGVREPSARHHAIECRINAENPDAGFQPSPGRIDLWYTPGGRGVRIDSHVYAGYTVPSHYDSMIAKVIAVGSTRASAIERMSRVLGEFIVRGIHTTIPFQHALIRGADFRRGRYDTGYVERLLASRLSGFARKES